MGSWAIAEILGLDGDALRIELAGQGRGILAALDVGDLCGGEGYHLVFRAVSKCDVKIVKVAPGGAHDKCTDS